MTSGWQHPTVAGRGRNEAGVLGNVNRGAVEKTAASRWFPRLKGSFWSDQQSALQRKKSHFQHLMPQTEAKSKASPGLKL